MKPAKVPAKWLDVVKEMASEKVLDLGDPALEGRIRMAVDEGRVEARQVEVDFSPGG